MDGHQSENPQDNPPDPQARPGDFSRDNDRDPTEEAGGGTSDQENADEGGGEPAGGSSNDPAVEASEES